MHLERRCWSNEAKVELFALVPSVASGPHLVLHVLQYSTVRHVGSSIMLWGCFSVAGDRGTGQEKAKLSQVQRYA